MTWKGLLARGIVGATLFVTLGGPSPGAVGSCSGDTALPCDVSHDDCQDMFCNAQLRAICDRNRRGATAEPHPECDDADSAAELANIARTCSATPNPYGRCSPPSDLAAQSCVDALYDVGNDGYAPNDVPECAAILRCGGP